MTEELTTTSTRQLFRQASLDRLSSPEQLDSLLQVTSSKSWLALGGIGILLFAIVVWSIIGTVPTKLYGQQCLLVKSGGINLVTSANSGRLTDLSVERGDTVTRGQIVGRIEQSDMLQKIKSTEARLKEVQAHYDQAVQLAKESAILRANTREQQVQNLNSQLASAKRKIRLLQERIESQQGLLAQGLITKQTMITTQLELSAVELETENIKGQFKQLDVKQLDDKKLGDNELVQAKNQLDDVHRSLNLMLREAKNSTQIVSLYAGKVLEVKVSEGQLVERGMQLLSIEAAVSNINEIEAYVYLPAADGKKIRPGMKVEISPSTVKREEYGFLPGYISSVADYPSTDQGLMRIFGNEQVVKQLSGTNAPIQIVAAFKPSALNASKYQWSTRAGPPFGIQSGTLCAAGITISEQAPISMVLPVLKRVTGI
ncbi:NHLP bacteriocin system secretion protein [Massilia sp. TSP1-1-2]|uniref:NHLP bacteriocin system secretion protein n=1 Tax=Massilia sp. TSP1-1-2 TaxID=2804649 RepID=UPI003CEBBDC0